MRSLNKTDASNVSWRISWVWRPSSYITLPCRSVVSCARLITSPCHLFLSSAALFSWYFSPLVVVVSVVQVYLGRPRDLLHSIFPSIRCSFDELCLIRCPIYCSFLVLNYLTISRSVPILLKTSLLVIFSVHDIFNTLRYTHISKASSLDNRDF